MSAQFLQQGEGARVGRGQQQLTSGRIAEQDQEARKQETHSRSISSLPGWEQPHQNSSGYGPSTPHVPSCGSWNSSGVPGGVHELPVTQCLRRTRDGR